VLALTNAPVSASWRGSAGVSGALIFSDNLFLETDGNDPESGGIVQLRPFISSSRRGNRVQARVNYGPSALWYPGNPELDNVQHVGQATLNTELIERYVFLDVIARANQQLINPRVNAGFDAVGNPEAFRQVASIEVRPRVLVPILDGRFATVRFDPGIGVVARASTQDEDSDTTGVSDSRLSVVSGPMFTRVPWSLTWRRRVFDTDADESWGRFDSRVGYIFSPQYRADLVLGYDDADFRTADGRSSGARWEVIFRWTPTPNASFEIGGGEAYFGDTFRFRGRYRHKRWAFTGEYDVTIQTFSTEVLEQEVVPVEDVFGEPIENPITGENVVSAVLTTPVRIDETFLRDRLSFLAAYRKGRNSAQWRWLLTRRDYSERDLDTLDNEIWLTYTRRLTGRLSASAEVRLLDHSEEGTDAFDYFQHGINLRSTYRLGRRTSLSGRIGRQSRDANRPGGDFSEHRLSLAFTFRF
jgi:uncharacterized protein (PEP-CTERM system associated)